jgi:hypothetical protein
VGAASPPVKLGAMTRDSNLPLYRQSRQYLLCSAVLLPSCSSSSVAALRRRGQRPGHHGQVPATHNERQRWLWPEPTPGIPYAPFTKNAPNSSCFVYAFFANTHNITSKVRSLGEKAARPELSCFDH